MKIRALRLADVGQFSSPIAIEGLSGGLDVLIGPNEHGKSTLLKALRAVLFIAHKSDSTRIAELRPYAGGHPLIEADLDFGDRSLRVRKHFKGRAKGASTELFDLAGGRLLAKGEAAEEMLAGQMGIGRGAPGLMWLSQDAALTIGKEDAIAIAPLHDGVVTSLREAIGREVEAAASGSGARLLLGRVKARLAELKVENSMRAPKGKPFAEAIEAQTRARSELGKAREAMQQVEATARAITEHRAELAQIAAPAHVHRLQADVETARRACQQGQTASDALARYDSELKLAETRFQQARDARAGFDRQIAERQRLVEELERTQGEREAASDRRQALAKRLAEEQARHDRLVQELAATQTGIEAALRASGAAANRAELAAQTAKLSAIVELSCEVERIANARDTLGLDAEAFADIERADREFAIIDARCAAASPTIRFTLEPGAAERLRVDGRAPPAASALVVERPVTVEIAGIGRMIVAPGANADRADDIAKRDELKLTLDRLLMSCGAASVAEARAKEQERAGLAAQLAEATARREALAPSGEAALRTSIASLELKVANAGPIAMTETPIDQLETRRHALTAETAAASARVDAVLKELRAVESTLGTLDSRIAHARQRASELNKNLPAGDAATSEAARMADAEQAAESHLHAAVRTHRAFAAATPSKDQLAVLASNQTAAEKRLAENRRQVDERGRALAGLEGRLQEAAGDGSGETVAALEGELTRLDAEIAAFELDRDGLQLLADALNETLAETRAAFMVPVQRRLAELLPLVLPGAHIELDDTFSVRALHRGNRDERVDRLSGGTQEQLAILVRLALGRMLADSSRPTPMVLDDPLVYADDDRLDAMFSALATGARAHQVLVLSCHGRAFAPLIARHGGRATTLAPWQP